MTADEFVKEYQRLKERNNILEHTHKSYAEFAGQLKNIAEQLKSIAEKLDPFSTKMITRRTDKSDKIKEIIEIAYNSMKNNSLQITVETLKQLSPDLSPYDYGNMIARLKKMPDVKIHHDGRRVRLLI